MENEATTDHSKQSGSGQNYRGLPEVSEAAFITLITFAAYLSAYYFDRGYLGYFNIGSIFVEVSVKKMLYAGATAIALIAAAWNLLIIVPKGGWNVVGMFSYVYLFQIFIFLLALASFVAAGFSVQFLTLLIVFVFLVVVELYLVHQARRKGIIFIDFLRANVGQLIRVEDASVRGKIYEKFGNGLAPVIMIVFGLPLLSEAAGSYAAMQKKRFYLVESKSETYIVVSEFQGDLLAAKLVAEGDLTDRFQLSGEIQIFEASTAGPMKAQFFSSGKESQGKKRKWHSASDLWERIRGWATQS